MKASNKAFWLFFVFLFLSACVFAGVESAVCNDYYRFDGLKFNDFYPESSVYSQGDNVTFTYAIENRFGSPLVEGDIKVMVFYQGPQMVNRMEDGDIVDDFYAFSDVNIQAGDKYSGSFKWAVPQKAKPGIYVAKVYFPVKKKFNIAGLTFMSSVPAKSTSFEVKGSEYNAPMLDKNSTMLNGKRYGFREPLPGLDMDKPFELSTRLINPSSAAVAVTYELFSWDDMETRLDSYTKDETVTDSRSLVYSVPGLPVGVYVARITARSGDWKSILKVRFYVKGGLGRFGWAGLDHFPLKGGDKTDLAFCFSNSAVKPGGVDIQFPVTVKLQVMDFEGNKILDEEYTAYNVTAYIEGAKTTFVSPRQLTRLKVKAAMYDEKGNQMDNVDLIYDYTKFLNIERTFKLSALETASEDLAYSIDYSDKYGDPLDGEAAVYLSAPDGRIVSLKEMQFSGKVGDSFSLAGLADGPYVLKAVEKKSVLSDQKTVAVKKAAKQQEQLASTVPETMATTTIPETEQGASSLQIGIIVAALLLLTVIMTKYKSSKEARK